MNHLINTIKKLEPLTEIELKEMEAITTLASFKLLKKGDYIFTAGDMPPISVYVKSGILRHFVTDNNGNEKIIQFFMEEAFFDDCGSYVNNQPIDYHIQAIEDTEIIYFYRLLHWVRAGITTIIIMRGVLGKASSGGKSTLLITF